MGESLAMLTDLYLYATLAGLAVVLTCGVLSVFVVVKRLGFVGQGISHSAFGGVGVAALLAAHGIAVPGSIAEFGVIVAFCVAAALGMAAVADKRTVPTDTAIGLFLVASMAAGAILVQVSRGVAIANGRAPDVRSWESILFGSILLAGPTDAVVGWVCAALVLGLVWWQRRKLLFWAFDEDSARAFGVPTGAAKVLLMIVLSLAVVTAMKLVGVVLATAMLVLPGATALKLTDRLWWSVGLSCAAGVLGLLGGLVLSLWMDWSPGPSVVVVMTGLFAAAMLAERLAGVRGGVAGAGRA